MDLRLYKQEGFWATFLAAILLIAIQLVTYYFKEIFVGEEGNLKIYGGLGVFFAIALVFKVKLICYVVNFSSFLSVLIFALMMFWNGHESFIPRILLLIASLSLFILLLSHPVKTYINSKSNGKDSTKF